MIEIEIDGQRYRCPAHELTGIEIKRLTGHEDGELFRFVDSHRHAVGDEHRVHLHEHERFEIVRRHHERHFEVDGKPYETKDRELTGAQVKHIAKVPVANILYRIEGLERKEVADGDRVHMHDGEKFMTQPPVGGAS